MKDERDERTAQNIRDAEERQKIRDEEREAEATRSRLQDQARWLEKRQELHEAAISELPGLLSKARISATHMGTMRHVKITRGSGASLLDDYVQEFSKEYKTLSNKLLEMDSKLDLYGSNESSKAYSEVMARLSRLSVSFSQPFWHKEPADTLRVTEAQEQEVTEQLKQLREAYDEYVAAARSDLRTNQ